VQAKRAIASFWSDKACRILRILHTYIPSMGGRPHCRRNLSLFTGKRMGALLSTTCRTRNFAVLVPVAFRADAVRMVVAALVRGFGPCATRSLRQVFTVSSTF
jgi:hypothetical protein